MVSFDFFATYDPLRNNALPGGFDSRLRDVFGRLAIWAATDSRAPTLANILSREHHLLSRKTPISPFGFVAGLPDILQT